jgi:hypothetical protein
MAGATEVGVQRPEVTRGHLLRHVTFKQTKSIRTRERYKNPKLLS